MSRGYTGIDTVATYLGRTLTLGQQDAAETLLDAAEAYIDRQTRRAWNLAAITGERYDLIRPVIHLAQSPVASIQSVTTRTTQVGDTPRTLTAGTDYELIDATRGEIHFVSGYEGRSAIALVSYTPNRPVPADISYAATLIVAESLRMSIFPDRWGLDDAQVDQNRHLAYSDAGVTIHIPDTAQGIILSHRKSLVA